MRGLDYIKRIEKVKTYRRKIRVKEIEARSYAMKARMNHAKLIAKKEQPPQ